MPKPIRNKREEKQQEMKFCSERLNTRKEELSPAEEVERNYVNHSDQ